MLKRLAITAAIGTAVVGAGGAALAMPGDSGLTSGLSSAPSSSAPTTKAPANGTGNRPGGARKHGGQRRTGGLIGRVNRLAHATWVTRKGQTNDFVTHVAIHGDVTAVSATSISVKAADGVAQTYTVGTQTKVRVRAVGTGKAKTKPKPTLATIGAVKTGAHVIVVGVGEGTPTARRIVTGLRR